MTRIAITGAAGRMGSRLVALARQSGKFEITAAVVRGNHAALARDAGELCGVGAFGLPVTADLRTPPQVLIDFTSPAGMRHWLKVCRDRGIAMLIGTTGLHDDDYACIDEAARDIPVLQATNMSLGVAVLSEVAALVARRLGPTYDIELMEMHHRFKKDAPSGTAMSILDALLQATGQTRDALCYDRHGDSVARQPGEIGVHALRGGDEVGRHTVFYAGMGERIELTHRATNRDTFVHGALRAAEWLAAQKPARYRIADVLGL